MHTKETEAIENLREVLGLILDHNNDRWRRYIAAILRNEADAEDVVQEAVRRMLDRNVPFYSADHVRMYLGRAISNAALELYNARKRERRKHIPVMDHTFLPAGLPNPHDYLEEQERLTEREQLLCRLQEGLTHIPQKQLEALRLTIMESQGSSIRDIGMNHGIAYSTLRHRSKQGLRSLRRYLRLASEKRR
ncbi:MAG: sigma-70 family RNA polymerase sigma factor [Acidobacteria bacterium]|nr:sigma-70 family RNA polymerase sigma factor [Acidobacteriota bacterium]